MNPDCAVLLFGCQLFTQRYLDTVFLLRAKCIIRDRIHCSAGALAESLDVSIELVTTFLQSKQSLKAIDAHLQVGDAVFSFLIMKS